MSNRASKLVREPVAVKAERAGPKPAVADVAPALKVLPLKIAPLLAPYRKHGRLSLRIERLPQLARLSAGRNNGDGSWSLGSDELEELSYMVPENAGEHSLAIRVFSVDRAAGNTLAVLDYLVSLDGATRSAAGVEVPAPVVLAPAPDGAALQSLRDELAMTKASLAGRDAELTEIRQRAELAEVELSRRRADAELVAAQADWKAELDKRLAATVAQSALDLQQHRQAWEAEQAERSAKLEERALERLLEARERWQKEQEERLAAVDAAWAEKLAKALAEARAAAGRGKVDEAELRALHEKLAALKAKLAERETALESAQAKLEGERERVRHQAEAALRKAEQTWQAKEVERLAAAETHWRQALAAAQSEAREGQRSDAELKRLHGQFGALERELAARDAALARTEAEAAAGRGKVDEAELRALHEKLAALKTKLAERETELDRAQAKLEEERERMRHQAEAALRKAEQTWQAKEAERLAAAETGWRQEQAAAQSEAREGQRNDADLTHLREQLGALRAALAARDAALAQVKGASADAACKPRSGEIEEALAEAERRWKAEETARIVEIETEWRQYSETALAEAAQRCEAAEQALAQLRLEMEAVQYDAATRPVCSSRTAEASAAAVKKIVLRPNSAWQKEEPPAERPRPPAGRRYVRDALLAAAFGASAIFAYPNLEPYLPPGLRLSAPALPLAAVAETPAPPAAPAAEAAAPAAPAPPPRMATSLKDANVRNAPSGAGAILSRLPRGTAVPLGEQRGEWILVRMEDKTGKTGAIEGWVHRSLLKEDAEPVGQKG
jgi:Bacterial SH3 domain